MTVIRHLVLLAVLLGSIGVPALADTYTQSAVATVESAATTNATSTKIGAANLYGFSLCNKSAGAVYFKFYNKATAPVVGTDAVFLKVMIPTLACRDHTFPLGVRFPAGLGYSITTGEANTDTTAVAAGDVSGAFDYK